MADKNVRVQIFARQRFSYKQTITFTRDEWEEFKKMTDREACDQITDRLNLRDVYDAEQIEEFEANVVDAAGKQVVPDDGRECW